MMNLKLYPAKLTPTFELKRSIPAAVLGVEDELVKSKSDLEYDLSGFMNEEFIEIRGQLSAKFQFRCGRCGDWLPGEVQKSDFQQIIDAPFPEFIDLTPSLREDILIDLPFAPTCQLDGEYRCPITGEKHPPTPVSEKKSLGSEEVWKALEQLKPKE